MEFLVIIERKNHNHNFYDYDPRCILHCKVHLRLKIDVFSVKFSNLNKLKYNFQFFISILLNFPNAFELHTKKLN